MADDNRDAADEGPGWAAQPHDVPDKGHIEELLKTANEAALAARTAWLGFLAILAYLLVTIASTTHVDLLLNRPVTLPILNVELPLFSFYGYAPILLLLLHLGLLVQHAVVARKLHELDEALSAYGAAHQGAEAHVNGVRSRLAYYVFAQVLVGHYRELGFLAMLMRMMLWMSLIVLPVLTLLAFQITFLPYHDMSEWPRIGLTWWHRILLIVDLGLIWGLWPNIKQGNVGWQSALRAYRRPFLVGNTVAAAVAVLFSVFVATIPGETTDRWTTSLPGLAVEQLSDGRRVFGLTALLFEGEPDPRTLAPDSPFARNIVIIGEDLVAEGERPLRLRGRELRYANLSDSNLNRSELAYAQLQGANLSGAHLQGANLERAELQGANLFGAQLQGAMLGQAGLQGANITGARLQGADLDWASLVGANLTAAQLQGASLFWAWLKGAILSTAQLQGANLGGARLQGAHLGGARLQGANLTAANVWLAWPPGSSGSVDLAETAHLRLDPLTSTERAVLKRSIEETISEPVVRGRVLSRLKRVLADDPPAWGDAQWWREAARRQPPNADELGQYLAKLACADADGHVARGIPRRAVPRAKRDPRPRTFDVRIATAKAILVPKDEDCPGRAHLNKPILWDLPELANQEPEAAE